MKFKTVGLILLLLLILALTSAVTAKIVLAKHRAEIAKLKSQVEIFQYQAEDYARALRSIREAAAQATSMEKAQ